MRLLESPLPSDARWEQPDVTVLHGESLNTRLSLSMLEGEVIGPTPLTPGNAGMVDLRFETLVEGAHVTSLNEAPGEIAVATLFGLRDFLRGGGFDKRLATVVSDKEDTDTFEVEMPWGSLQLVVSTMQTYWSQDESTMEVRAQAQMHFARATSLHETDEAVATLRDLIVFSTGRPSYVASLAVDSVKVIRMPATDTAGLERSPRRPLILNPATLSTGIDIVRSWFELRDSSDRSGGCSSQPSSTLT